MLAGIMYNTADAQVRINVSVNNNQPDWGPAGYNNPQYYYMPDMDMYYDVRNRTYTYYERNRWVTRTALPQRYAHHNLYKNYKVVVNEPQPWRRHDAMKRQYTMYRGRYNQANIRDARKPEYTANRGYNNNRNDRGRDNDNRNFRRQ